jgi:hypothetical protein
MPMKRLHMNFLIFLLIMLLIGVVAGIHIVSQPIKHTPDVYFGLDIAFSDVASSEELVNQVSSYTNFIVVGSTVITYNMSELNGVCQYIYDAGLTFVPFWHINPDAFNQTQWVIQANQTWGNRFWGLFPYDEAGGAQIDRARSSVENGNISLMLVQQADNYTDAANKFVTALNQDLAVFKFDAIPLMTSDYALYDFDYKGGYNVVLAEFAYNLSKPLQLALCRGAATMNNEDWGVMITDTYTQAPYLENATQLYNDMVYAYQNGAKFILVFDSNLNYTENILQQDQLNAMKQFWNYIYTNPQPQNLVQNRIAYVLPAGYGFGFRGPNDTIWGLWPADSLSANIWGNVTSLLEQYGPNFDIVYEDSLQFSMIHYNKVIFWNGTES